jgi:hypothetical protein
MVADSSEAGRYKQAWIRLRLRRRIAFGLVLLYLPAVALVLAVSCDPERYGSLAAKLWLATAAIAGIWLSLFRCPRCGRLFGVSWPFSNPFARRCLHCGLPTGSTGAHI